MQSDTALITVAICTYNRHEQLTKLLPSLFSGQTLPRDLYKVLVADNSDDAAAREAFAKTFQEHSKLSIIESSPSGISRARNAALEKCTTPYIVYLDDDASPKPEWLSAILTAFRTYDPAIVAGPIYPTWPGAKPDWLPHKYIACLTILDHGSKDRWLSEGEFAYGANMAFKTNALRDLGGFNVGLGRKGGWTLLSEEELEVQLGLRQRGHRIFYAASAGVAHTVHSNRLTRNYFRARMTWQVVSEMLRDPPLNHLASSRREIRVATEKLGLGILLSKLMTYRDADTFSSQLDIIYHLFAILLGSKDLDDPTVEGSLTVKGSLPDSLPVGLAANLPALRHLPAPYHPSAPILPSTRHLIIEGQPSHFFLYTLYANLADSQLLLFPHPMWHNFDEALAYIERSITSTLETLTFVTLEVLIYGTSRYALSRLIASSGVPCFGILHRLPENSEQEAALREVGPQISGIIVPAMEMCEILQRQFQLRNVFYLPLHPPHVGAAHNTARIRKKVGAAQTQVVFSMLGEARRGKGIELVLEAINHITRNDLQQMFFLIAGRSEPHLIEMITNTLSKAAVDHYVDLRSSKNPLKYAVLSDSEFEEYIDVSDVGLLLYQNEQRRCASGVAPDYIWRFKPLIAFEDSVIGRITTQNELGIVIKEETPTAVAQTLTDVVQRHRRSWKPTAAYHRYRAESSPDKVLTRLAEILSDQPSHKTPSIVTSSEQTAVKQAYSGQWPPGFTEYLSSLPLLHSWDGGKTWNTGGFQADHLSELYLFLKKNLPPSPMLLETGAGNSTICFLFLNPARLTSIAPEPSLFERIRSYCANHSISVAPLDARASGSEWTLPQMAMELRDQPPHLDFVLIDGCHNWPMVFVDFCYANYMLKTGGLIMIDDVHLQSVKELARMLSEQPEFRMELNLGKSLIFRRVTDCRRLGEWVDIPYILRTTNEYARTPNPFSLYPALDADITSVSS